MRKINNNTSVDRLGASLNLYREPQEDIIAFQERIKACLMYGVQRTKESFEDSLDYLTATRSKNIMTIDTQQKKTISFDGVFLEIDGVKKPVTEIKFLKDLKSYLLQQNFAVTELQDYEDYLQTKNVIQFNSKRTNLGTETPETNLFKINERFVSLLYDNQSLYKNVVTTNDFERDFDFQNRSQNLQEMRINDESEILKESNSKDTISYTYENFPLNIKWSDFRYYNLNDESSDYRLKTLSKVYKNKEEEPYRLSQNGARLFNKCLKISNTYWGK